MRARIAAARALMQKARAVWVLGDPILSREAGFEFLVEQSLERDIPLVGAGVWEVRQGAVFCSEAKREALARAASQGIVRILEAPRSFPRPAAAGPGGLLRFNRVLSAHFGLSARGPAWVEAQ